MCRSMLRIEDVRVHVPRSTWLIVLVVVAVAPISHQMTCTYGERGSLTVVCVNATSRFFKMSSYRFDHLDETMKCINCNLESLDAGVFDISGNQIKKLDITNSNIKVIHAKAFIGLIFMEKILLSHNPIQQIYPEAFTGVRKVKYLELEDAISNLVPRVFKELHSLEVLILRNNSLVTIEPGTFEGLYNLKILDLSYNSIKFIEGSLTPLNKLLDLNLEHNKLQQIEGNEFTTLTSLLILNLGHNDIIKFQIQLDENNNLRSLILSANDLNTKLLARDNFKNINSLEELDLSMNPIEDIPIGFFLGLNRLRILNLNHNKLKVIKTGSFSGLPHLDVLKLADNAIEEIQITGNLAIHNIHSLDLSNNKLNNYDYLGLVEKMENLKYVNLLNNEFSCPVMQDLELEFEEDGVEYHMSSTIDEDCPKSTKTLDEFNKSLLEQYEDRYESSTNTWLSVLTCFIVMLVLVLFYIQFYVLRPRNDSQPATSFVNVGSQLSV